MSRISSTVTDLLQVHQDGLRRKQGAPVHHAQCHRREGDSQGILIHKMPLLLQILLFLQMLLLLQILLILLLLLLLLLPTPCSQVGDEAQRRVARGVEDLDFYIGDEAMNIGSSYAVKVSPS